MNQVYQNTLDYKPYSLLEFSAYLSDKLVDAVLDFQNNGIELSKYSNSQIRYYLSKISRWMKVPTEDNCYICSSCKFEIYLKEDKFYLSKLK